MASFYIPSELKQAVRATDEGICVYCKTSERNSGIPSAHDHIIPRAKGGSTKLRNLCHSCRPCNEYKGDTTHATDPLTEEVCPLFHPRNQQWHEHFEWSSDYTELIGKTPYGRVTIIALKMNNQTVVGARRRWVSAGWHPPDL